MSSNPSANRRLREGGNARIGKIDPARRGAIITQLSAEDGAVGTLAAELHTQNCGALARDNEPPGIQLTLHGKVYAIRIAKIAARA
jgi:hypothetical protein